MFEHISTALEECRQCSVSDYVKDNHRVSLSKTVPIIEALVSEDARSHISSLEYRLSHPDCNHSCEDVYLFNNVFNIEQRYECFANSFLFMSP